LTISNCASHGLSIATTFNQNAYLRGMNVVNNTGNGINIQSSSNLYIHIEDSVASGNTIGVYATACTFFQIKNSNITNNSQRGIQIQSNTYGQTYIFEDNQIVSNINGGLYITTSQYYYDT